MDRNLCLNRKSVKLYKIVKDTIDIITGLPLVIYHYIENNALLYTMPKDKFENEFLRLKIK